MNSLFKKIKNKINDLFSLNKINPHTSWKNLLFTFFIIVVLLILFSLYFLYQIRNQQIFKIIYSAPSSPNIVKEELLKKVEESFERRLIIEKEIKNNLKSYSDPSL
jgi:hypothetical protein